MTDQLIDTSPDESAANADIAAISRDYRILIDHSPDTIVVHDGRQIVFTNPAGLRLIGASDVSLVVGHPLAEFVTQESFPPMVERILALDHVGAVSEPTDMVLRRVGGRHLEVEAVSVLTRWEGRRAFQVILRDLTPQRSAEKAAARAARRFANIVANLVEGVMVLDALGAVESLNPAGERILGIRSVDVIGHGLADVWDGEFLTADGSILDPTDFPHVLTQQTAAPVSFVIGLRLPDRSIVWTAGTCKLLDAGVNAPMVLSFSDITSERLATAQLEHQATHDSLTGLPNRLQVVTSIAAAIADLDRHSEIGILFADLDNLKSINDSVGHSVGDEVLRLVAERLRETIDTDHLVGRVGGDEFVVVVAGPQDVAAQIHRALTTTFRTAGGSFTVSASIGAVSVCAGDRRTIDDLLRDADAAMYAAKAAGGNRTQLFTEGLGGGQRRAPRDLQSRADSRGDL